MFSVKLVFSLPAQSPRQINNDRHTRAHTHTHTNKRTHTDIQIYVTYNTGN